MSADTGSTSTTIEPARRALGAFVRLMRDRAEPRFVRGAARRRVRGLRREEVATAAGISVTWYTWLEQGRPVRVSARTLRAVARALRLTPTEREHLLRLGEAAARSGGTPRLTRAASETLRRLVEGLVPHPAYAVNGLWDVLHANRSATALFGDFAQAPGLTDNVLRRLILDEAWRERFEDWETIALSAITQFRATTGHLVAAPEWRAFVDDLAARSAWFATRWRAHGLTPPVTYTKVVRHPAAGRLPLLYSTLSPVGEPADVQVVVYTPTNEAAAGELARLSTRAASPVVGLDLA